MKFLRRIILIRRLFNEDIVVDDQHPVRLSPFKWTGRLFEIKSSHMRYLAANHSGDSWLHPLPKAGFNGVIPRSLYEDVKREFGSFCEDTISPDYGFGFRAIGVTESVLFYDKSLHVNQGLSISNGRSFITGDPKYCI